MSSNFKQNLDKIVEEERKAKEAIITAEIEREDILNKEREKIKRELKEYEEEMKGFLETEVSAVNSNDAKQEDVVKKINKEMTVLYQLTETNKTDVIDFIINNALEVDLSIPDVVKGQFSAKLGATK